MATNTPNLTGVAATDLLGQGGATLKSQLQTAADAARKAAAEKAKQRQMFPSLGLMIPGASGGTGQ